MRTLTFAAVAALSLAAPAAHAGGWHRAYGAGWHYHAYAYHPCCGYPYAAGWAALGLGVLGTALALAYPPAPVYAPPPVYYAPPPVFYAAPPVPYRYGWGW